jgi:simple sugar transport system ATP-binding protein
MMVGREVVLRVTKDAHAPGDVVLNVRDLVVSDARGLPALCGVGFDVRAGEIYGIAGIEGNGQSELIETLTGLRKADAGEIAVSGASLRGKSPAQILRMGVGHVPEDRLQRGLVAPFTVAENAILGHHRRRRFNRGGLLDRSEVDGHATELIEAYDIRTPGATTQAEHLSGGNQQKIVLARVLSSGPCVLIASQPTRGVDVGATEFIHNQLLEMRAQGVAILLLSADLDEVRSLSDRIGVIYQGRIVAERPADAFTEEALGLYMAGEDVAAPPVSEGVSL